MLILKDVLPHFNGKKSELADALGISKQAISKWDEDKPIPELQEKKLRYEILPETFGQDAPALSNDETQATNTSWGGRFSEPTDAFVARFTASVDFDKRLAKQYNPPDFTGGKDVFE